jgi:hypothetical protein
LLRRSKIAFKMMQCSITLVLIDPALNGDTGKLLP